MKLEDIFIYQAQNLLYVVVAVKQGSIVCQQRETLSNAFVRSKQCIEGIDPNTSRLYATIYEVMSGVFNVT